ncbi:sucrase ferredoxin [Saccharopolyspora gloriosae]|uniref:sucrase ferredoxin n=1 Tax=Saccharopolyspora gloriosae TaxID=455344 RepID=UPI001FB83BCB|nr:sucrase ferredoxin [Saccharopolyspora gloriosae]
MTQRPAPTWPRCSFVAQAAADPLEGSAPPAQRWFLIEHPGPWGHDALTGSGIDPGAVTAVSEWAAAERARVALVRRPGRGSRGGTRRWFRVDSRPGQESIRTGEFTADAELAAAVHAPGEPDEEPLNLVCAHGRHDTCCAVRGRPVAAALAASDPGRTWECSHVGGCRFAPALVLLPHGFLLGNVPVQDAIEAAGDYRAGRLDPRWVRGRCSLPPAAQAAQHHARAATGITGVDALGVIGAEPDGETGWRVELAEPACTVLLRERWVATGRPLTCAATSPGRMRVFDLVELRR